MDASSTVRRGAVALLVAGSEEKENKNLLQLYSQR